MGFWPDGNELEASLAKKLKEIGRYGSFRLNQNVYGRLRTRFAGRRRGLAQALRGRAPCGGRASVRRVESVAFEPIGGM
jgi:hypothetical protein